MERPKRRILCAEDDEDTCELLTLVLGESGYEVVPAYTFADALTKALTGGFDGYLIDNGLPDGTGEDLCRQIREFDENTPIVFYSADAFPKEIEKAMKAGANAYLVKPIAPQEVTQKLEELLGNASKIG